MIKHLNITVRGRVQGVWYRASTEARAGELGLKGFVQNQPDGSVYLEAEGPEAVLSEFLNWCRKGPVFARVDEVRVEEGPVQGFAEFGQRR
jgi:acylphosphatase